MNPVTLYIHYVSKHETGAYAVVMDDSGLPFCVSLQPTHKFLAEGEFKAVQRQYFKGGYKTFEILCEGHSEVLFHKGNHQEDSLLCFLLGEAFEEVEGKPGIAYSGHAFEEFWHCYNQYKEIIVEISHSKEFQNAIIVAADTVVTPRRS